MSRRSIGAAAAAFVVLALGGVLYLRHANSVVGPWTDARGRRLPDGISDPRNGYPLVIHTMNGLSHCDWESVVFLDMSWPPGTIVGEHIRDGFAKGTYRQYVRDPDGVLEDFEFATTFAENAPLPSDARPTGLHRGPWQLWVSPSESDRAAYLVKGGKAERWPRATGNRPITCN